MAERNPITRRDFLRTGAWLTLGGLAGWPSETKAGEAGPKLSRVVLVRDEGALDSSGRPRFQVLKDMLDRAVAALWGLEDPAAAWRNVAGPGDVVGVKSNAWSRLPTPVALERAIRQSLLAAGVREANLTIDDRGARRNPVFRASTVLVNVRPMRTHHWAGLGTLIKNYIMFVNRPYLYHGKACEGLGAIWHLPQVKGKTRLNILVMLPRSSTGSGRTISAGGTSGPTRDSWCAPSRSPPMLPAPAS